MSEEDRKSWLEIMEGKEPVYSSLKVIECKYLNPVFASVIIFMVHVYLPPLSLSLCTAVTAVNEQGCEFVKRCIDELETRGMYSFYKYLLSRIIIASVCCICYLGERRVF